MNHQAKRIIIRKTARIKTIGVTKIRGNFDEISFQAKFLRKATKSQEFRWNSFALLLHDTVFEFLSNSFFPKIWVAKLGVRLICECGSYAGVYGKLKNLDFRSYHMQGKITQCWLAETGHFFLIKRAWLLDADWLSTPALNWFPASNGVWKGISETHRFRDWS